MNGTLITAKAHSRPWGCVKVKRGDLILTDEITEPIICLHFQINIHWSATTLKLLSSENIDYFVSRWMNLGNFDKGENVMGRWWQVFLVCRGQSQEGLKGPNAKVVVCDITGNLPRSCVAHASAHVIAVYGARGGPRRVQAGGFNVLADQCITCRLLPCRKKMLHHLWLCWSGNEVTEANSLGSCCTLIHDAGGRRRYKRCLQKQYLFCDATSIRKKSKRAIRGSVSSHIPFCTLLYDCLAMSERVMTKVWHTWLTTCQCPPSRNTHTTETCGGGGFLSCMSFLSFVIICFMPLCFQSWLETFWIWHDVNTDKHELHRQYM